MKVSLDKSKVIVRWILFALAIVYIITGFGITQYQVVEKITLGLLTKALAQKIHFYLLIPFLILLIMHIYLSVMIRKNNAI
jgi:thiosulfate reductase cytochrome b subunit